MKVFASITCPKGKKKIFPITENVTIIGRSPKVAVTINDGICSGRHAQIFIKDNCVFIEDLNSKNGIFLNEIKVIKQRVYIGDEVRMGQSKLQLEHSKMSNEDIKQHTPESKNRKAGSITLEVESFREAKERSLKSNGSKSSLKDSKLYQGVEENNKQAKFSNKKLAFLDKLSTLIDTFLSVLVAFLPFGYLFFDNPQEFEKLIGNPTEIIVGENLIYLIVGLVIGFMFFKWNRSSGKSSIGEKLLGL